MRYLQRKVPEFQSQGRNGLDLVTTVLLSTADELHVPVANTTINRVRRDLEKEKLQSRILLNSSFPLLVQLGEKILSLSPETCDANTTATIGALAKVQKKCLNTFVRVCVENGVITYIFFSLPQQRLKGSCFGEMRVFDDKHGVSSSEYHLALCSIQTNEKVEIAAFGLFNASTGANWGQFILDCKTAFKVSGVVEVRKWKAAICDGDGQISSAIARADPSVAKFTCWYHFKNNVRREFLALRNQWEELHSYLESLLYCDHAETSASLIRHANKAIGRIKNGAMKKIHTGLLDEIVRTRLLFNLQMFTQGWTSQSPGESMNSIMAKLGIGANCPCPACLIN